MKFLIKLLVVLLINFNLSASDKKDSIEKPELSAAELELQIENLIRILQYVDLVYVDDVDKKEMIDNAIKGMLSGLDPHSSYLTPEEQTKLSESSTGKFGGLGIVVTKEDDFIKIVSPIDDTPAYMAGLKSGDTIIKIDDNVVRGMTLEEGVKLMRGEPKTSVTLTILREGEKPFTVNIVRDIITIVSAKGYLLESDLGYLRISNFQAPTKDLVEKNINDLIKQNNNPLKSLIIDLRNNPGGLFNSAVDIADLFIDNEELIVYTQGKIQGSSAKYFAKKGDITKGAKIVVLINEGSASSSEIVAGALKDNKRAVIIGKKSFGKGSVQTNLSINEGYGLKITTAKYYTPSGESIQAKGITPDIELENVEFTVKDEENISIIEAELKNHLENSEDEQDNNLQNQKNIATNSEEDNKKIEELKKDYFIYQAINSLKLLSIMDGR